MREVEQPKFFSCLESLACRVILYTDGSEGLQDDGEDAQGDQAHDGPVDDPAEAVAALRFAEEFEDPVFDGLRF